MQPTTNSFPARLSAALLRARPWIVLAMLLALHAGLLAPVGSAFQRVWLMVHFGLFLLWQPFFATERELKVFTIVMLMTLTAAILWFLSGWMIVSWMVLMLGVLGGRVFTAKRAGASRLYFLVAFSYLLAMLLLWAVPTLLLPQHPIPGPVSLLARAILPLLLLLLALLPGDSEDEPVQVFDFFYAVFVFQLVVVLVLGSLALMRFTDDRYFPSVALTMFSFGVALFVLAVLWSPRSGFGGLRTYFSRYLLSVGMPFELWMRRVAELAEAETQAGRFLEEALKEIATFPWMRGGLWKSEDGEGKFGETEGHAATFTEHGLELTFYTNVPLSPALFLHVRLLAQVVGEFYEGKRRETTLKRNAYLEAVHETGARLTHDIKNLLQSLYALTSAAPSGSDNADEYNSLLQRQLPQLTHRLHATLEQLRAPDVATHDPEVDAAEWWEDVRRRFAGGDITFEGPGGGGVLLPPALFDSVLDNCIDNARAKVAREPGTRITIVLSVGKGGAVLDVRDTGSAIPDAVATKLMREPLARPRGEGLSIGLYQAARQAVALGYRIDLASNSDGAVCFRLRASR
ncbi:hypothetical protein DSM104443_00064 [Usitatibacter rugosus]|uniref:Histidine kinase/HSP90-like ATPase domain-containing protein n=1 Tax=Usitatibacter rugosus TaxID=2732067 RepID=A0A6M4GNW8_9PROT|nr:HAMP domain-containing sensor histidine kinase [Usitatibacter rugosus]QJR09029.1 hypothetical protein DSM104443_00064 [Usitatibacter rugosus]